MNPDYQSVGAGGVIGGVAVAILNLVVARFWPSTPKPAPVTPAPDAPAVPTPQPPAPSTLDALLQALLAALFAQVVSGKDVPPAVKSAAPHLRELLDKVAPPKAP